MAPELTEWRQDLHRHPELGYAEHRTADDGHTGVA